MQVIWGIERLVWSLSNPSWLDGKTVAFARYVAEGMLTPTVLVETEWWDIGDTEVISDAKAATALLGSSPTDSTIPGDAATSKNHMLPIAYLAPLRLMVPLLTSIFLPPIVAYVLVNTKAESLQLTETVHLLLAWLKRGFK